MARFITLREEFESETGASQFDDQKYIEWLEAIVEKQRQPDQSEELCKCGLPKRRDGIPFSCMRTDCDAFM